MSWSTARFAARGVGSLVGATNFLGEYLFFQWKHILESHGVISNIETVQTCVFWGLSNLSDCSRRLYGISAADLHLKTSCVVLMLKPVGVNLTGLFGH